MHAHAHAHSDSNSSIQVYSGLGGARANDDSIILQGSIYSGFEQGRARLSIGIKPAFSELNVSSGLTALVRQPYLYVAGADAFNDTEGTLMQTDVMQVHIAQGNQQACPTGFVLTLTNDSAVGGRPGECVQCKPGFYSLSPLAGPTDLEPGCLQCPVGANCMAGGAVVTADASWWLMEEEEESSSGARRTEGTRNKKFQPYKCPVPGDCQENNTCVEGKTGVACGKCLDNHVLQVRDAMHVPR